MIIDLIFTSVTLWALALLDGQHGGVGSLLSSLK